MDEKSYDLLEKLYFEVQSVKSELKGDIQELRTELKGVKDTMGTKEDLELAVEELKTPMISQD